MSLELVRSYLLGTSEENSAALIEERYFTDRAFFLFVQAVETALIEDYISDRLAPLTRSHFEQRYLKVPALQKRLEEVRGMQVRPPAAKRAVPTTRLLLAAAVLLLCVGGALFWAYRDQTGLEPLPGSKPVRPILATLYLSPGIVKSEVSDQARLRAQTGKGDIRLVLELPGQPAPTFCAARLSVASPDGTWKNVWSTPRPVASTTLGNGQQLSLILDSSLLGRGDYEVEITGTDKQIQETYFFRVASM
jgi:hypothetical protein